MNMGIAIVFGLLSIVFYVAGQKFWQVDGFFLTLSVICALISVVTITCGDTNKGH